MNLLDDNQIDLTLLHTVDVKSQFVMKQQDRYVIDNAVFEGNRLIMYLQTAEVSCVLDVGRDLIVFGHVNYARLSIFKWNGHEYRPLNSVYLERGF